MPSEITCPKCGGERGWNGPTYRSHTTPGSASRHHVRPPVFLEWLGFTCQTCGFERTEPTRDEMHRPRPSRVELPAPRRHWWMPWR